VPPALSGLFVERAINALEPPPDLSLIHILSAHRRGTA